MKLVKFSNGNTFGTMLVNSDWYEKHKEIEDTYQLYLLAKKDKSSEIQLVFILDSGEKTTDMIINNH